MKEESKNSIMTIAFCFVLGLVFILNFIAKDIKISNSERRTLKQFPEITISNLLKGKVSNEFEEYAMDQFIGRDLFRTLKSYVVLDVFKQKDNNDLFIKDNSIYKIEYPLDEKSVQNVSSKIPNICNKYFNENNKIYYTIVPDKSYFLDEDYLKMDYEKLEEIMNKNLSELQYINVFPLLENGDYYRTDTHWKQENLEKIVDKISSEMQFSDRIKTPYIKKEKGEFYGVYYGQLGRNLQPDTINYLTNEIIENATVYNYETNKNSKIYDESKWKDSLDKYEYYLSGAVSLMEINNPNAETEKELIGFRDSFGSSIIPLFTEAYSKITIVDTRYISQEYLSNYLKVDDQDVLFLYSTLILNQSSALK